MGEKRCTEKTTWKIILKLIVKKWDCREWTR
jgi:hypothetical protein